MITSRARISLVIAVMWTVRPLGHLPAATLDEAAIHDLHRVWHERESRVQSARFTWTETTFELSRDKSAPDKPTEVKARATLLLDQTKTRFDVDVDEPSTSSNGTRRISGIGVFDGHRFTRLARYGRNNAPQAVIRKKNDSLKLAELKPIMWTYRPSTSLRLNALTMSDERPRANGHICFVVEHGSRCYWVDPERGWSIVRCLLQWSDGAAIRLQIDISHIEDEKHGWVPRSWRIVRMDRDRNLMSDRAYTVTDYAINEPMPASKFTLDLPAGTVVFDETDPNQRLHFVLEADGSRRPVRPEDVGREWLAPVWIGWQLWLLAALTLLAILGLVTICWKRKDRSSQ